MMLIQIFSEYAKVVEAGRAKALTCPMHEDPIFLLSHYLNSKDNIFLRCFACGYKQSVGQDLYSKIKLQVEDYMIDEAIATISEPEKKENE